MPPTLDFAIGRLACTEKSRPNVASMLIQAHDGGLSQGVEIKIEAYDCGGRVRSHRKRVHGSGVRGEEVAVRMITLGRGC